MDAAGALHTALGRPGYDQHSWFYTQCKVTQKTRNILGAWSNSQFDPDFFSLGADMEGEW